MDTKKCIETRASVRQYAQDPVPQADLKEMVRLAGLAPSANNAQPWRFVAITNKGLLEQMAAAVSAKLKDMLSAPESEAIRTKVEWWSTFFKDAPAVFAVCIGPYEAVVDAALEKAGLTHDDVSGLRGRPDIQSIGASVQNLLLAAHDMGYGACWLSGPLVARQEMEALLEVKEPWRLAALVSLGKPAGQVRQREKKAVEEIFEVRA